MTDSILHIHADSDYHGRLSEAFLRKGTILEGCDKFNNVQTYFLPENRPKLILISIDTPSQLMMDFFRDIKRNKIDIPVLALISPEKNSSKSILKFGFSDYIARENDFKTIFSLTSQFVKKQTESNPLMDFCACVIDDDSFHTKLLEMILTKKGVSRIKVYSSAEEFLENPYECNAYIVDVFMKKISGIKLVEKIRKMYPESLIFVVSSVTEESIATTAFQHGADDFLYKPVIPDILMAKIKARHLKK